MKWIWENSKGIAAGIGIAALITIITLGVIGDQYIRTNLPCSEVGKEFFSVEFVGADGKLLGGKSMDLERGEGSQVELPTGAKYVGVTWGEEVVVLNYPDGVEVQTQCRETLWFHAKKGERIEFFNPYP